MSYSYSKISTFQTCPYLYKLQYIDKLEPIEDDSPSNPLFVGTAAHEGVEGRSVEKAIESYTSHFSELTDLHEIEILKLKTILPKAITIIPEGQYEVKLTAEDGFIGYIDILVPVSEGVYDILDLKCSNNVSSYKSSPQVHLYKYFYEKMTGNTIRDLYYVFIPKSKLRLSEEMTTEQIKQSVVEELSNTEIRFEKVVYDPKKIADFLLLRDEALSSTTFRKTYSINCKWCKFASYCRSNGKDISELTEKSKQKLQSESLIENVRLFDNL